MEISSDMDRCHTVDDEIDIDLDLTGDQLLEKDDDYMAEDSNFATVQDSFDVHEVRGGRDDEMLDDEYSLNEAEDNSPVHDEDLKDAIYPVPEGNSGSASDTFLVHTLGAVTKISDSTLDRQAISTANNANRLQSGTGSGRSDYEESIESDRPVEMVSDSAKEKQGENFRVQEQLQYHGHPNNSPNEVVSEVFTENGTTIQEFDSEWNTTSSKNPEEDPAHPSDLDGRTLAFEGFETGNEFGLETSINIHPVTMIYQGSEMSLFPPADQDQEHAQTYFLHDENLAGESIAHLFGACREVLADSIEEEAEELEITIGELGLQVSEVGLGKIKPCESKLTPCLQSGTECSTTTLAQILDLYVHLQHHDGDDTPGPLNIVLRTKFNFSHRLKNLLSAAAQGKGLSQLGPSEGVGEVDQNSNTHSEQEADTQEEHSHSPKQNSNVEVGKDFFYETLINDDANIKNPITHQQLENITPEARKPEVKDSADLSTAATHEVANQSSESDERKAAAGSSNTLDDAQKIQASIDEPSQQDFSNFLTTDEKKSIEKEQDSIDDKDEQDHDPESSAGSSTVQGDIHEVAVDSYNRSLKKSTLALKVDKIPIQRVLDSDSATRRNDQPSMPTFTIDARGDDSIDYTAGAEVEELQSTNLTDEDVFKKESASVYHQEGSLVDVDGGSRGAQISENVEEESQFEVEEGYDEYSDSSYSPVDSIDSLKNPQTNLEESIQPSEPKLVGLYTTKQSRAGRNAQEITSESIIAISASNENSAQGVESLEFYETDEIAVEERTDPIILESTYQALPSTSTPQDRSSENDEITYEGDGNEPEPSKVYESAMNPDSGPAPSKRMRSDHEGLDSAENRHQGRVQIS